MTTWNRTRVAGLRQRVSSLAAHATRAAVAVAAPTEVGGPFVTALDIQTAGQGVQDILAAYRAGTATDAQLRAIGAIIDANAEAAERDAAYGAGPYQGYRNGYDPRAAELTGDHDPDPDLGPET